MFDFNYQGSDATQTNGSTWQDTVKVHAKRLISTKSLSVLSKDADNSELKRTLNAWDLTMIGIGGIIGTGIFVLTGQAAAAHAGPAVILSFIIAGIASGLAALCYSEMASMIPVAGSAYTYSYATMGELVAWIIGWDLILEYLVGAATVSVGWAGYLISFFEDAFGLHADPKWVNAPFLFNSTTNEFVVTGNIINLPAVAIVLSITFVLIFGMRESAIINSTAVVIKLIVVLMFIFATVGYVKPENWQPFVPHNEGSWGKFGASGVFQGATVVFFSYIGFDAVSTTAQECKNPQRDLPIGILSSLTICTVLYILVSLMLTGVVPYTQLGGSHPIAVGVQATGITWLAIIVEIGAIAGLTSVLLVNIMGQPRIFFSMANDGLLPAVFAKVHPKFGTPYVPTLVTGVTCALLGGILPIDVLAELTSIGTLFAFLLVCVGMIILRLTKPDQPRAFKVPFGPYAIPLLGALASGALICVSTAATIERLFSWMAVGLLIYIFYGRTHSKLNNKNRRLKGEVYGDEDNYELNEKTKYSEEYTPQQA